MGYLQKEWLVYFYEAPDHPYQDWLKFLKKGFKHCGVLGYVPQLERWIHLEWTHAGIRHTILEGDEKPLWAKNINDPDQNNNKLRLCIYCNQQKTWLSHLRLGLDEA